MKRLCAALVGMVALGSAALAQSENPVEEYRRLLADPFANPGYLFVDRGEALWHQKRGPKNASLEECDLGLGPASSREPMLGCRATSPMLTA